MIALLAAAIVVSGQERVPGQRALNSVRRLECSFSMSAAGEWRAGALPEVRVIESTRSLRFRIIDIDPAGGTATIAGVDGTSSVSVQLSGSNLHFLDMRPNGAAMLTTVFSQERAPGRLKAVHTRTAPDVSQFYGDCEILE